MKKMSDSKRRELLKLAARSDNTIDLSDIPATHVRDWKGALRGAFYKPVKQQLTVRIDADVLDWLKKQGKGYQSRLNAILRAAMLEKLFSR